MPIVETLEEEDAEDEIMSVAPVAAVAPAYLIDPAASIEAKIHCPCCMKPYSKMTNWRRHFRKKHEQSNELQLREAEKLITDNISDTIARLQQENDALKSKLNRLLLIRTSKSLIRRSIKILRQSK